MLIKQDFRLREIVFASKKGSALNETHCNVPNYGHSTKYKKTSTSIPPTAKNGFLSFKQSHKIYMTNTQPKKLMHFRMLWLDKKSVSDLTN